MATKRSRQADAKPTTPPPEQTWGLEALAEALVEAQQWRESSSEDRAFFLAQEAALSRAFGLSAHGTWERLRHLARPTVEELARRHSPFAGMLEAPRLIVDFYQRFAGPIEASERELYARLRELLLAMLEASVAPGKTSVTTAELRALGFDPATRPCRGDWTDW